MSEIEDNKIAIIPAMQSAWLRTKELYLYGTLLMAATIAPLTIMGALQGDPDTHWLRHILDAVVAVTYFALCGMLHIRLIMLGPSSLTSLSPIAFFAFLFHFLFKYIQLIGLWLVSLLPLLAALIFLTLFRNYKILVLLLTLIFIVLALTYIAKIVIAVPIRLSPMLIGASIGRSISVGEAWQEASVPFSRIIIALAPAFFAGLIVLYAHASLYEVMWDQPAYNWHETYFRLAFNMLLLSPAYYFILAYCIALCCVVYNAVWETPQRANTNLLLTYNDSSVPKDS